MTMTQTNGYTAHTSPGSELPPHARCGSSKSNTCNNPATSESSSWRVTKAPLCPRDWQLPRPQSRSLCTFLLELATELTPPPTWRPVGFRVNALREGAARTSPIASLTPVASKLQTALARGHSWTGLAHHRGCGSNPHGAAPTDSRCRTRPPPVRPRLRGPDIAACCCHLPLLTELLLLRRGHGLGERLLRGPFTSGSGFAELPPPPGCCAITAPREGKRYPLATATIASGQERRRSLQPEGGSPTEPIP
ncbi:hypothetical protein KIL84_006194 [Mauremys mutica]|uniref:Uncharacterized protein n=1 Tax=Mauremys mutica TaxID=74926 RepID=A0A9D3X0H4_9SAUR|nr:hypothetical protein KIL84_006194 [Mauremys mutica]